MASIPDHRSTVLAAASALSLLVSICHAAGAATTRPASIGDIIRELKARQSKLDNIVVESETWEEECPAGSDKWERTPIRYMGTAWFKLPPGSKARLDVWYESVRWTGGAAPYAEDSYSAGFDGEVGWIAQHTSGAMGRPLIARHATTLPDRAALVFNPNHGYRTGAAFSPYLWDLAQRRTLADFLESIERLTPPRIPDISIQEEQIDGVAAVRLTLSKPAYENRFWFDPQRGYALLGYYFDNKMRGQVWVIADDHVTKLPEAAPGIWYPTEATPLYARPGNSATTRLHYRATKVTANARDFDERIFQREIPPGYVVDPQEKRK